MRWRHGRKALAMSVAADGKAAPPGSCACNQQPACRHTHLRICIAALARRPSVVSCWQYSPPGMSARPHSVDRTAPRSPQGAGAGHHQAGAASGGRMEGGLSRWQGAGAIAVLMSNLVCVGTRQFRAASKLLGLNPGMKCDRCTAPARPAQILPPPVCNPSVRVTRGGSCVCAQELCLPWLFSHSAIDHERITLVSPRRTPLTEYRRSSTDVV